MRIFEKSGSQEVRKLSEQRERNPEEHLDEGSGSQKFTNSPVKNAKA